SLSLSSTAAHVFASQARFIFGLILFIISPKIKPPSRRSPKANAMDHTTHTNASDKPGLSCRVATEVGQSVEMTILEAPELFLGAIVSAAPASVAAPAQKNIGLTISTNSTDNNSHDILKLSDITTICDIHSSASSAHTHPVTSGHTTDHPVTATAAAAATNILDRAAAHFHCMAELDNLWDCEIEDEYKYDDEYDDDHDDDHDDDNDGVYASQDTDSGICMSYYPDLPKRFTHDTITTAIDILDQAAAHFPFMAELDNLWGYGEEEDDDDDDDDNDYDEEEEEDNDFSDDEYYEDDSDDADSIFSTADSAIWFSSTEYGSDEEEEEQEFGDDDETLLNSPVGNLSQLQYPDPVEVVGGQRHYYDWNLNDSEMQRAVRAWYDVPSDDDIFYEDDEYSEWEDDENEDEDEDVCYELEMELVM
ncbi:hypothetical protein B0T17DRAFT_180915, partial [Bombardia bombarda]